jgi:GntR family transcriptional regulator
VLPFRIDLVAGVPVYEQLVAAVTRAVVRGELREGDEFPSVRAISKALRINPNTAQRAVAELTSQGFLRVYPGVGTRVARPAPATRGIAATALTPLIDDLVLEARRRGVSLEELRALLETGWTTFDRPARKGRHG